MLTAFGWANQTAIDWRMKEIADCLVRQSSGIPLVCLFSFLCGLWAAVSGRQLAQRRDERREQTKWKDWWLSLLISSCVGYGPGHRPMLRKEKKTIKQTQLFWFFKEWSGNEINGINCWELMELIECLVPRREMEKLLFWFHFFERGDGCGEKNKKSKSKEGGTPNATFTPLNKSKFNQFHLFNCFLLISFFSWNERN